MLYILVVIAVLLLGIGLALGLGVLDFLYKGNDQQYAAWYEGIPPDMWYTISYGLTAIGGLLVILALVKMLAKKRR